MTTCPRASIAWRRARSPRTWRNSPPRTGCEPRASVSRWYNEITARKRIEANGRRQNRTHGDQPRPPRGRRQARRSAQGRAVRQPRRARVHVQRRRGMPKAQVEQRVKKAPSWLADKPQHNRIVSDLELVELNLKNLK